MYAASTSSIDGNRYLSCIFVANAKTTVIKRPAVAKVNPGFLFPFINAIVVKAQIPKIATYPYILYANKNITSLSDTQFKPNKAYMLYALTVAYAYCPIVPKYKENIHKGSCRIAKGSITTTNSAKPISKDISTFFVFLLLMYANMSIGANINA